MTAVSGLPDAGLPARRTHVGRYVIEAQIGAGAMGVVYRARDPKLGRAVAIKLVSAMFAGARGSHRLLREAQAMARVRHPNVVPIFDVGLADDAVFLAMPLIDGGTLRDWLRERPRSCDEILDRFLEAGRGLAAAHASGLVHRDFKPDNVLIDADGQVQVADFGIACLAGEDAPRGARVRPLASGELTQTGDVIGTPAYMAPEQLRGRKSSAQADQFSFCVALWEGVYGDRPFLPPTTGAADPIGARLAAIAAAPLPPRRSDRPAWLGPMIARGLNPDPKQRWPSLTALLDAIADRQSRRAPRHRLLWLALVVALVFSALALALAVVARPAPVAAEPAPESARYRLEPLMHRELQQPAMSPDGYHLAMVAGNALWIRETGSGGGERQLIERGIDDNQLSWSPESTYLAVSRVSTPGSLQTAIVDLTGREIYRVPVLGRAAFLSEHQIAVYDRNRSSISLYALGATAPTAICTIDGEILKIIGLPDGAMAVQTEKGDSHALLFVDRDCQTRNRFTARPLASIAATDTGTIVAQVKRSNDLIEISADGDVLSRRQVPGEITHLLRRVRGIDYVVTRKMTTRLHRLRGHDQVELRALKGRASFSLSPDEQVMAWIDLGSQGNTPGRLQLSTLDGLASGHCQLILDSAWMARWSPDSSQLAVLSDAETAVNGSTMRLVVVDRAGHVLKTLLPGPLDRTAAPIWLDDHRIAVKTRDDRQYHGFDLVSDQSFDLGFQGIERGETRWLARSPSGVLAMWSPGFADELGDQIYVVPKPGDDARPLHLVGDIANRYLLPAWSSDGELLIRALELDKLYRVDLGTGELAQIAELPRTAVVFPLADDNVMLLRNRDLLSVDLDVSFRVAAVKPDEE